MDKIQTTNCWKEFKDYTPPSWDVMFMRHVYEIASKSKDTRTKIGAVLVKEKRIILSGYNGIIEGVEDNVSKVPERYERPEKYFWQEHAERNVCYFAARKGIATEGATLYTQGVPCCDCIRGILQSGIVEIVVHKQWQDYEKSFAWQKWEDQAIRSNIMLKEKGIPCRIFDGIVDKIGFLDGKMFWV